MKPFSFLILIVVPIGLISTLIAAVPARAEAVSPPYLHRFLISDNLSQKLLIYEKDDSVSWEYLQPGWVYDGEQLSNGNVLYCWFLRSKTNSLAGVREVTPDKRIVFEYAVAKECHSVQRLPDGLTLIEDPSNKRLIEVDRQGNIAREIKLQVSHDVVHDFARQCRKLPNGNYLVAHHIELAVAEYAPDGAVLHRFPVKGKPFGVTRLSNGNTLVGAGGGPDIGNRVIELDSRGNTVWSFEPSDFPPDTNLDWVLGTQRLPNGNTVIAHFLGHGKDGQGISLLEVTPDKKVRWTFREKRIILLMQVLDP
jgi:hypothetical protein